MYIRKEKDDAVTVATRAHHHDDHRRAPLASMGASICVGIKMPAYQHRHHPWPRTQTDAHLFANGRVLGQNSLPN